jgi:hypothetical protein
MSFQEYKRRSILPLAGLVLAAFYFLVFVPMQQRAASFDLPLQKDWEKLCAALEQSPKINTINFRQLTNQLAETRQALTLLDSARQKVITRLELGPMVRARMSAPFQLVDYENERSQELDQLARLAKEQQVSLDPAVLAGLPEHTVDVQQPSLLWAALSFTDGLLRTALSSNVVALLSLQVPLALTNSPTDTPARWTEIPLQLEFTASAAGALRLLQSLPLRPEEASAAGMRELPANKAPLFLDGLILKKQSPDRPDELRVWLRLVGFVSRE